MPDDPSSCPPYLDQNVRDLLVPDDRELQRRRARRHAEAADRALEVKPRGTTRPTTAPALAAAHAATGQLWAMLAASYPMTGCDACEGTGMARTDDGVDTCTACDGEGQVPR